MDVLTYIHELMKKDSSLFSCQVFFWIFWTYSCADWTAFFVCILDGKHTWDYANNAVTVNDAANAGKCLSCLLSPSHIGCRCFCWNTVVHCIYNSPFFLLWLILCTYTISFLAFTNSNVVFLWLFSSLVWLVGILRGVIKWWPTKVCTVHPLLGFCHY